MAEEITAEDIATAATQAKNFSTDNVSVENHPLPDVIEAKKEIAREEAATRKLSGVRMGRFIPGGAAPR